jgi:hypothetical protein
VVLRRAKEEEELLQCSRPYVLPEEDEASGFTTQITKTCDSTQFTSKLVSSTNTGVAAQGSAEYSSTS